MSFVPLTQQQFDAVIVKFSGSQSAALEADIQAAADNEWKATGLLLGGVLIQGYVIAPLTVQALQAIAYLSTVSATVAEMQDVAFPSASTDSAYGVRLAYGILCDEAVANYKTYVANMQLQTALLLQPAQAAADVAVKNLKILPWIAPAALAAAIGAAKVYADNAVYYSNTAQQGIQYLRMNEFQIIKNFGCSVQQALALMSMTSDNIKYCASAVNGVAASARIAHAVVSTKILTDSVLYGCPSASTRQVISADYTAASGYAAVSAQYAPTPGHANQVYYDMVAAAQAAGAAQSTDSLPYWGAGSTPCVTTTLLSWEFIDNLTKAVK